MLKKMLSSLLFFTLIFSSTGIVTTQAAGEWKDHSSRYVWYKYRIVSKTVSKEQHIKYHRDSPYWLNTKDRPTFHVKAEQVNVQIGGSEKLPISLGFSVNITSDGNHSLTANQKSGKYARVALYAKVETTKIQIRECDISGQSCGPIKTHTIKNIVTTPRTIIVYKNKL